MANYANLKAAVAAVVKSNGAQEITGANLQSTLLSIIDSLGANYTFAGVATPETDPGTPDQNVAYIGGPGTYANFGSSFIVPPGAVVVLKYTGSWTRSIVRLFDGIGKPLNSGIFVDYSRMMSYTSGSISYVDDNSTDCLHIHLPESAVSVELTEAVTTGDYWFFSTPEPKTDTYLGHNATGAVPQNARLAVCNCTKASNSGGYDACDAIFAIKTDDRLHGGTYDEVRYSADNFRILLKTGITLSAGDVISIGTSSTNDMAIIYLPPFTGMVAVTNASLSGNYLFFSSTEPATGTYIGKNSTGTVPEGAVLAVANISRADSTSDYYKYVTVEYTSSTSAFDDVVGYYVREKAYTLVEPDSVMSGKRVWNGAIEDSTLMDVYIYNNIDSDTLYSLSGKMSSSVSSFYYISYWDENDSFLSYDRYVNVNGIGTEFTHMKLNVPIGAVTVKMNVQKSYSGSYELDSVALGSYYDFDAMGGSVSMPAPLKVVVNSDKSFYVRYHIDGTNDGILVFDYLSHYGFNHNCIMVSKYFFGGSAESDAVILAKTDYQRCADMQSPMFTSNFGPLFSNHGYSTPRVVIEGHGLTDSDVGSEWTDQNSYHYIIGKVSGNYIYLLPVITTTGTPGEETRGWKWYSSPYPTQITRVGGETLTVDSSSRWDIQVSELSNVRVLINGKDVDAGTYQCSEVELAYEQIGYNPIFINTWFPTPVYNGIMLKFDRHFTVTGCDGFLSCTSNTVLNNLYPYPLRHYIDVVPQFPFQMGDYKPYIYIPKMNKVTADIDFREEFVSVDSSHSSVAYARNSSDLADIDDMPDRAYCYLKTDGGDYLYGCAGGHSLVRGMSVKSVRNNYIAADGEVGIWNPPAGNKHYNNIIETTGETGNIMPATFINEFEGYVCWYKPQDGIQVFYHKSKDCYVVYIHTNQTISKGYAILPDFMNGMGVDSVVERTAGIDLLTSTVIDGKLFFTSDNSSVEYNWEVLKMK